MVFSRDRIKTRFERENDDSPLWDLGVHNVRQPQSLTAFQNSVYPVPLPYASFQNDALGVQYDVVRVCIRMYAHILAYLHICIRMMHVSMCHLSADAIMIYSDIF